MIRYLQNSEIDYEKWDACISKAYNGNVYAWSWYLDVVCEGWEALVKDDYELVMPVTAGKKYGISYLFQPPFTQQLGVYSAGASAGVVADDFLEQLSLRYRFAEINMNRYNKISHPDFKVQMRRNYELDLIGVHEKTRNSYTSNTLRNLRKAEKEGISIVWNADPQSIITMFRKEKGGEIKMHHTKYNILEKLMYRASYKKQAVIAGAYDSTNQLCAGAFLLQSHQRIVFLFSANNKYARQNGVMHFLIDRIIEKYSGKPLILDFEGSEIPGLARFYAGFGSTETQYPSLFYDRLPIHVKAAIKALKLLGLK